MIGDADASQASQARKVLIPTSSWINSLHLGFFCVLMCGIAFGDVSTAFLLPCSL